MKGLFEKDKFWKAKERSLQDILQKWIAAQETYASKVEGDYSWNYRERSCIGFLAAATWLAEGVALEEWRTEKQREGGTGYGRCDLWIRHNGQEYFIEAKHDHVTFRSGKHRNSGKVRQIKKRLRAATNDAKKHIVKCESSVKRLGVLFIGTKFRSKNSKSLLEQRATWLKKLNWIPHTAIAWLFLKPQSSEKKVWESRGIIMLAREI
ncbi:MAG: hypothetical protein JWR26_144 [Pedosphaera sp.]|nr:hypothetical protein [Pedosphaera sp.]